MIELDSVYPTSQQGHNSNNNDIVTSVIKTDVCHRDLDIDQLRIV